MKSACLAILLTVGPTGHVLANIDMPAIFGSHMVLQQGIKVPIWGTANSGEEVTISFAGQTVMATAGLDGEWSAVLAPLTANSTGRTLTVVGGNAVQFEDVLVGEVWVCSGQSNMVFAAGMGYGIENGAREIKAANFPNIRMITVPAVTAQSPQRTFDGKVTSVDDDGQWDVCTPDIMKSFSAVGYFFGHQLHQRLDVPVGLIGTYWSGTPAQAWASQEALDADPVLKTYMANWEQHAIKYPTLKGEYDVRAAAAKAQGKTLSVWFDPEPAHPVTSAGRPANLFNGMISPLIPFAIRGAVWYQGESNAGNAEEAVRYRHLFPAMITDWRTQWGEGDFPFFFVQLCTINKRQQQPVEGSNWAILRESQLKTLDLPNTGMAVIFDTDPSGNLHPPYKKPVGERLALIALKVTYGKDIEESGPVFDGMEVKGDNILLSFKHVGSGLVSKPNDVLKGFAVADKNRKFVWADANIVGDTVEVSNPAVKDPVAVRYGWADNPEASLYNKAGLPASPFRTDAWENWD
jgi:sialate O-acetylesterase